MDLYLCYEGKPSKDEEELLNKYWQFEHFFQIEGEETYSFRCKHKYKVYELKEILNFEYDIHVTHYVTSNCFISSNSNIFNCGVCQKKLSAKTRSEFKQTLKKLSICDDCKRKEINETASKKIDILNSSGMYIVFPEFKVDDLDSLTYLEQIVLLVMMLEMDVEKGQPINISYTELNLTGVNDLDSDFLSKLIDKNAIYKADYESPTESITYLIENEQFFNADVMEKLVAYMSQVYKPGIYFLVPDLFKSHDDLIRYLYKKITNPNIHINWSDVEAISEFVITTLLFQAYQLIDEIKKEQQIPIDMNMSLDTLLTNLVKKYPMRVVFNILRYQAKFVAAKLYAEPHIPFYIQNKLLVKKVDNYLRYLEKNNIIPYEVNLPDDMIPSKIEHFTSYYILDELQNWSGLSGDDIVAAWLNSLSISEVD